MTRTLTVGSLFAGIGGLDLGVALALSREGMRVETVWQVEWNPYCRAVLARHFPRAAQHGDITGLDAAMLAGVDGVIAGFPCQPASLAGKRKAQDDDRWLWPDVARLLGDLRPRFVFLENVAGLLSAGTHRGGALGEVLGDLARLRYDAWWACVRAEEAGAPHRRERWFCLAVRDVDVGDAHRKRSPLGGGERRDVREELAASARAGGPELAHPERRGRRTEGFARMGCAMGRRGEGSDDATTASDADSRELADAARIAEREPADTPDAVATRGNARMEPRRGGELADADGGTPQRNQPQRIAERGDAPGAGARGEGMADADDGRGEGPDAGGARAGWDGAVGNGADAEGVADPRAIGREWSTQRDLFAAGELVPQRGDDAPRRAVDRGGRDGSSDGSSDGCVAGARVDGGRCPGCERCDGRIAQPGVGGGADGVPAGLDRTPARDDVEEGALLATLAAHRWPAGRGEPQAPWEAPRVAAAVDRRRDRLSALGNAVVPQQAALAFAYLVAEARRDGVEPW